MVPDRRFPNRGSGGKTEKLDMADYKNINIRNKRATFDYEIIEEWIAGIVLVGTEIKSVRLGKASITDSYCYFDKGELWIRGVNIAEYGWGDLQQSCSPPRPQTAAQPQGVEQDSAGIAGQGIDRGGLAALSQRAGAGQGRRRSGPGAQGLR